MHVVENYSGTERMEASICDAARELTIEAEGMKDCKPFHLAQKKIDEYAGDKAGTRFWRSVWVRLAAIEYGVDFLQ